MDQTFKLLLLISFALSQNNLDYSKASKRIEEAVRQDKISRQEANDRYRNLEKRLQESGKRGPRSNDLSFHFSKLGITNHEEIKLELMSQGITISQIEPVFSGMIRIIHSLNMGKEKKPLNKRLKIYFEEVCNLSPLQIKFVEQLSHKYAK